LQEEYKNNSKNKIMHEKLLLATELYYQYDLSQKEISKRLGISRPWVSKLLKRAKDTGIVRIEVMTSSASITKLEETLKLKYKLVSAKVIKNLNDGNILKNIGKATANYILSIIKPNDLIGVSWGRTLSIIADQFIPIYYPNISVIPILGGMGTNAELLSNQIATKISTAFMAKSFLLHAPAFTIGKSERDTFLKDPSIKKIVNMCKKCDIVLIGLGSLRDSTIEKEGYISSKEIDELEGLGAVGDIALRFIDADGQLINHKIHDRLVAYDFRVTRHSAGLVIGIAAGIKKVPIIQAALRGNWLDVLITDSGTAEELIKNSMINAGITNNVFVNITSK